MAPVVLSSTRPVGKVPLPIVQLYVPLPPEAVNVRAYGCPVTPEGKKVVVTTTDEEADAEVTGKVANPNAANDTALNSNATRCAKALLTVVRTRHPPIG
jgi:hypothetical protein